MQIEAKLDFFLEHLESLLSTICERDDFDELERRRAGMIARQLATQFGFIRRYRNASKLADADNNEVYLPERVDERLASVRDMLEAQEFASRLPSGPDLMAELDAVATELLEMRLKEASGDIDDEQLTVEQSAGVLERLTRADELMSIACTEETLGEHVPAEIFGRAIQIGQRARQVLDRRKLRHLEQLAEYEDADRMFGLDRWGDSLWTSFLSPELRPMLLSRAATALQSQRKEAKGTTLSDSLTAGNADGRPSRASDRVSRLTERSRRLRAAAGKGSFGTILARAPLRTKPRVAYGAAPSEKTSWADLSDDELRERIEETGHLIELYNRDEELVVLQVESEPHILCVEFPDLEVFATPNERSKGVFVAERDMIWVNMAMLEEPVLILDIHGEGIALRQDGEEVRIEQVEDDG